MSHAANLGRLEIVKAMAAMGAKDFQHAFGRAVLQGKLDCARWLLEQGAELGPGAAMGACEALKAEGLRFIAELGGPITDDNGNRLAPLAMILQTYSRNPPGKHEMLELLSAARPTSCPTRRPWRFIAAISRDSRSICAAIRDCSSADSRWPRSTLRNAAATAPACTGVRSTGRRCCTSRSTSTRPRSLRGCFAQGADANARASGRRGRLRRSHAAVQRRGLRALAPRGADAAAAAKRGGEGCARELT